MSAVPQHSESKRFITGRCPMCGERSEVCDQQIDVRREALSSWWFLHLRDQHPQGGPIFEIADAD